MIKIMFCYYKDCVIAYHQPECGGGGISGLLSHGPHGGGGISLRQSPGHPPNVPHGGPKRGGDGPLPQ